MKRWIKLQVLESEIELLKMIDFYFDMLEIIWVNYGVKYWNKTFNEIQKLEKEYKKAKKK
jgi:hypothetical protein